MGIITIDTRPFLLQVLERGRATGRLQDLFFDRLEETGASMAVKLAQRLLNVTREEDIIQAANIVIGVMSLGLDTAASHEVDTGVSILADQGPIHAFRLGWTLVARYITVLVQGMEVRGETLLPHDAIVHQEERKCLMFLAADTLANWSEIRTLFFTEQTLKERELSEALFYRWLQQTYYTSKLNYDAYKAETLLISLLLGGEPHAPLSITETRMVLEHVAHNQTDAVRIITERLPCIRDAVPEVWTQHWCSLERSTFDTCLPNIAQRLQRGTRDDILEITRHHLFVERELEEY